MCFASLVEDHSRRFQRPANSLDRAIQQEDRHVIRVDVGLISYSWLKHQVT